MNQVTEKTIQFYYSHITWLKSNNTLTLPFIVTSFVSWTNVGYISIIHSVTQQMDSLLYINMALLALLQVNNIT